MKNLIVCFSILLIAMNVLISCDEEKEIITKVALLKWQGPYELDGCGFFLEIDYKDYKPDNEKTISDEFKQSDSTDVIVKFKYLENNVIYYCGFRGQQKIDGINIISIKKVN